jgi:predicted amidohydrolase YtcJ
MQFRTLIGLLAIVALGANGCGIQDPARSGGAADTVLKNGAIYTADIDRTVVQAVAIRDGEIVFRGSDAEAEAHVGADTRVVDLQGRMALPGLHDAHIHALGIVSSDPCELNNQPFGLEELVTRLRKCLEDHPVPNGEWFIVSLWNPFSGNEPTDEYPEIRSALDAISDRHPIRLYGSEGHHSAFNSVALARATNDAGEVVGLDAATIREHFADLVPFIGVDGRGEPNGHLTEHAVDLLRPPSWSGILSLGEEQLPKVAQKLARFGITSVMEAAGSAQVIDLYEKMAEGGSQTFRLTVAAFHELEDFLDEGSGGFDIDRFMAEMKQLRARLEGRGLMKADAVKLFVDGSSEGNATSSPPTLPNAAMLTRYHQPIFDMDAETQRLELRGYVDVDGETCQAVRASADAYKDRAKVEAFHEANRFYPQQCQESDGVLLIDSEILRTLVARLDAEGFSAHMHVIGDRAVRAAMDAVAHARSTNGDSGISHHLVHIQVMHPSDQQRAGELGLYFAFTYGWIAPEFGYDASVVPFMSKLESLEDMYDPARAVKAAGGTLMAGSDAPVDSRDPSPFLHMEKAITRAEEGEVWPTDHPLDVHDAIAAYTINGATAMRQDHLVGSIEVGKRADLIVIDRNIVELHQEGKSDSIGETRVLQTWLDGRLVYEAGPRKSS